MLNNKNDIIYINLEPKEEILAWKHLLHHLSLERINKDFQLYQDICLSNTTSFSRIEATIQSLFNIKFRGHDFFPHFKQIITSEAGSKNYPYYFFRIRKLNKKVHFNLNNLNQVIPESFFPKKYKR